MRNVTDISTSKKLEPYMGGVETFLSWVNPDGGKYNLYLTCSILTTIDLRPEEVQIFPAYTTDDLIERLPIHLDNWKYVFRFCINCDMGGGNRRYHLSYRRVKDEANTSDWLVCFEHVNLTTALAQLVIFCGENNYLQEGEG